MMVKCPNCHRTAKQSTTYLDIYVCDCLGFLEDITIIDKFIVPSHRPFSVTKLNSVLDVMAVARELNLSIANAKQISQLLADGYVFQASQSDMSMYLLWIRGRDNLIPAGFYFYKINEAALNSADRVNFRAIVKDLISQGFLQTKVFSTPYDDRARFLMS